MYILLCADGSYYTGSTTNLELRLQQHQSGEGANHTKKHRPVKLVYFEEYDRIDHAFYREKQVQGWSRKKKEALINGQPELLPELAASTSSAARHSRSSDARQLTSSAEESLPSTSSGNGKIASGNEESASGNGKIASGNEEKASGNEEKTSGNEESASGNEEKTSGNEEKASDNDKNTSKTVVEVLTGTEAPKQVEASKVVEAPKVVEALETTVPKPLTGPDVLTGPEPLTGPEALEGPFSIKPTS